MSSSIDLERQQALFARCLDHPASEWEQVLTEHCDDPDLRERVRQLLRHHSDTPTHDSGFLQLVGGDPERIGPYHVSRRLGEGGMGIVYVAEQHEPVRRHVAVKVLRGGYSSREVLARFDAERQALALMSHANIARIYDAGTTADHRPYIVMEYVPGEHITHYCERRHLPLRARLEIFLTVCEAVHHAHQKGVIHRDLKPSNILVMEEDGRPVPKIIDFGIAKAVTQRLTDHTLETQVGSLLGTPDYMSPEQAELSPLDVDTRADVYALGAVLYQLLTGVTPLDLAGSGGTLMEMQRLIKEQAPPPPSQRVSGSLRRAVRGELDWITCKALEKERVHRYASAADLARDIRAHLNDETVLAGPPSQLRKMHKLVRRHWLASSLLVLLALVVTFSQIMLLQKNRELLAERDRANREAEIADHVTRFTAGLFEAADPGTAGSSDISARELLDMGSKRILAQDASQDADVRAALLEAAGNAYRGLGAFVEAEHLLLEAVRLRGNSPPAQRATALANLALLRHEQGDYDAAIQLEEEALALLGDPSLASRQLVELALAKSLLSNSRLDEADAHVQTVLDAAPARSSVAADALLVLGKLRTAQGRLDDALPILESALELQRTLGGELSPGSFDAKTSLVELRMIMGDMTGSEKLMREFVDDVRQVYGDDHITTGIALNELANVVSEIPQKRGESIEIYRQALQVIRGSGGERHPEAAIVLNNMGATFLTMQEWQQAVDVYRDAIDIRRAVFGTEHPHTVSAEMGLALALNRLEEYLEARQLLRHAVDGFTANLGASHWRTANARTYYGMVLGNLGEHAPAERELRQALGDLIASLGERHWRTASARAALSTVLLATGNFDEARSQLVQAVATTTELFGVDDRRVRELQERLDALPD